MKYTIIKWLGTIIIIAIGIYAAYNMTYNWKIKEVKLFKLSLPESTYQLSDNQKLKASISLSFKNRDEAKAISKDKDAIRAALKDIFKEISSESFSDGASTDELRLKILMDMQKAGFSVEQIGFETHPTIL